MTDRGRSWLPGAPAAAVVAALVAIGLSAAVGPAPPVTAAAPAAAPAATAPARATPARATPAPATAPAPARAEPPYEEGAAAAWKGYPVARLEVRGAPGDLGGPLRAGLHLASSGSLLGEARPLFYPAALDEDLARARLFLARRGWPRAHVAARFESADDGRAVAVTLQVKPGEPVRVRAVEVAGVEGELRDRARPLLRLAPGHPFDDDQLSAAARALVALLNEAGHAGATVEPRVAWHDSTAVDVTFVATPGDVNRFGAFDPGPIGDDLAPLARRTSGLRRGDRYSPQALARAEENIRRLELFRQIRLTTRPATAETLDVAGELRLAPLRTLAVTAGYWTDDQVRLGASWKHRNLLRAGRGFGAKATYSRFRQDLGLTAWRPAYPGPRSGLSLSLDLSRQAEDAYTLRAATLTATLTWRPTFADALSLSLAGGRQALDVKTDDVLAFRTGEGVFTVLTGTWSRDTADDRLSPTRGGAWRARAAITTPGLPSDFRYVVTEAERVRYWPVGRTVLAGRLGVGWGRPLGGDPDLPPNERLFAGGSTSMRGFKRRQLGPVDESGEPLGGEARLLASLEARVPLRGRVKGAVFVDAGQVWARRDEIDASELEVAVGPGLMVDTPIGPLRADVGFRLTDVVPGQPGQVVHVSVGNPF